MGNGNATQMSKTWEWGMKLVIASFIPLMVAVGGAVINMYDRQGDADIVHADQKEAIEKVDAKVDKLSDKVDANQDMRIDIHGLDIQLKEMHNDIKEIKEMQYRRMSGDNR